jgi:cellobiose phosphorylase
MIMQYGYFDEKNKEYVITNPETPAPWANYLGSPEYGAIISNNAAGYSFVRSGAHGRHLRFRFNTMISLPGRYIYVRDAETNDYWSGSWQPCGKPLDEYKSECRHGTAYTIIKSTYKGIETETAYYVPQGADYEVWHTKVTNVSEKSRDLSVTAFCEFTNENNYEQDQVNLQYTQFITRTSFEKNKILQHINEFQDVKPDGSNGHERFLGLAGGDIDAYCGSLDAFTGNYRTYGNPVGIEKGLENSLNYGGNCCAALQTNITLAKGETKEFTYVLGQKTNAEADQILHQYTVPGKADAELSDLKRFWHAKLSALTVKTPDEAFNNMINVWNAYQCFITFIWSRAASLVYCGLRNGYGYRDTVQDIQGIIHLDPETAKDKIRFMLSAQVDNGGGLPLVKFNHNAGFEDTPDQESYVKATGHPHYRADDALWLFPTIEKYLGETGDAAFLDEVIVYANGGEDTVYAHLKRAIDFSLNHMGPHDMPAGLHADWNDCLRMGAKGESTFVAFQLYMAMSIIKNYAVLKDDNDYAIFIGEKQAKLSAALMNCWNEDRFIRGIREDGIEVGNRNDPEASMWLNPQSWSVISGYANKMQINRALKSVEEILDTPYGAKLLEKPYKDNAFDGALMVCFNLDMKENGGIFSQPQGWIILAESLAGNGNAAYRYFRETSPAAFNDRAEVRVIEPYAHGQFTEATRSPFAGRSNVPWLTGTASTVMVGCVEGILGLRPDLGGLKLSPAIPSEWENITITKKFRGKTLNINVNNAAKKQGADENSVITLNGVKLDGLYISADKLQSVNEIELVI